MFHVITPPHPEFTGIQLPQSQSRLKALARFCSRFIASHTQLHYCLGTARGLPRPSGQHHLHIHPDEKPSLAKASRTQRIFKCLPTGISRVTTQLNGPTGTWTRWFKRSGSARRAAHPGPDLITPKFTYSPVTLTSTPL